jgi:hypothetical protein
VRASLGDRSGGQPASRGSFRRCDCSVVVGGCLCVCCGDFAYGSSDSVFVSVGFAVCVGLGAEGFAWGCGVLLVFCGRFAFALVALCASWHGMISVGFVVNLMLAQCDSAGLAIGKGSLLLQGRGFPSFFCVLVLPLPVWMF